MPTYEYRCENCKYEFEIMQSIKDDPLTKCPECGKNKLKKIISGGAGVIFKGSGFYQTDYKNKSKGHKSKAADKKSSGTKVIDTTGGSSSSSDKK